MILSTLRKTLPEIIAQEIVSVQPMVMPTVETRGWILVDQVKEIVLPPPPEGYVTVDVNNEILEWILTHDECHWHDGIVPAYNGHMTRLNITNELYSWLLLRWS